MGLATAFSPLCALGYEIDSSARTLSCFGLQSVGVFIIVKVGAIQFKHKIH